MKHNCLFKFATDVATTSFYGICTLIDSRRNAYCYGPIPYTSGHLHCYAFQGLFLRSNSAENSVINPSRCVCRNMQRRLRQLLHHNAGPLD